MPNWIAHPLPENLSGQPSAQPIAGSKHGTLDWIPWLRCFYFYGGDHGGKTGNPLQPVDGDNNFRNELWRLSSPDMQWSIVQPYCTGRPGNRPHRPDWGAFVPDVSRKVVWWWGGPGYTAPGEWHTQYCDINEFAPWLFWAKRPDGTDRLRQPILAYDPETDEWINPGFSIEPKAIGGSYKAWGAVHDPEKDELIRVCYVGDNSPPNIAFHLHLPTGAWTYYDIKTPTFPAHIANARVGDSKYFFDPFTRKIWMVDPHAWESDIAQRYKKAYLCSYNVDTHILAREAEIPQAAGIYEFYNPNTAISITFCGDPLLRRGWWVLHGWNKSRDNYGGGATGDFNKYDWTDVYRVIEIDLDTLESRDITPSGVDYPAGGPTRPRSYFHDPRRLAITSGAFGRTVGYDPLHKLLVVCAGFASYDIFSLQVADAVAVPEPEPQPDPQPDQPQPEQPMPTLETLRAKVADVLNDIDLMMAEPEPEPEPEPQPEPEPEPEPEPDPSMPSVEGTVLVPIINMGAPDDRLEERITAAWNGAAFDYASKRFYLTVPGGHTDWKENESFLIDLPANRSTRLHGATPEPKEFVGGPSPTNPERPATGIYLYTDGKPASRHTYWMPVWLPKQGKVLMATGSCWDKGGQSDHYCGWLDPQTGLWEHKNLWPYYHGGIAACYDFGRDLVYHGKGTSLMHAYDPATDSHTPLPYLNHNFRQTTPFACFAFVPPHDCIYAIQRFGFSSANGPVALLKHGVSLTEKQEWTPVTVNGDTTALMCQSPGWEYDEGLHAIASWAFERPDKLALLHLDGMVIEERSIPAPPAPEHSLHGVFGRFRRYDSGRYVLMTSPFHPITEIVL